MSEQDIGFDNNVATDAQVPEAISQEQTTKTYTQEEFDRHMAGLKNSISKKYEKQFAELGDITELRALKQQAETRKTEEQMKKGEFEKILQEKLSIKDAEIQRRDNMIKEYKVDLPLVNAAAKYRAVAPDQVKALLKNSLNYGADGEVEVVDSNGQVRYNDKGQALTVDDLVREFLDTNPHFVQSTPATTAGRSAHNPSRDPVDVSKLDLNDPAQRAIYAEWRKTAYSGVNKIS
jgi:hypothetical protein